MIVRDLSAGCAARALLMVAGRMGTLCCVHPLKLSWLTILRGMTEP